jgi:hypothetical protein
MIVAEKRLLNEIGLYCEHQIFGEDYDIQLRLVDKAKKLICRSAVVAELAVNPHSSISRDFDAMDRTLFTISSCLRAEATVFDSRLRRVARANRAWCMLDLAALMLRQGRGKETRELVAQSFFLSPTGRALRLFGRTFRASAQTEAGY